jgi:hypothetical protein
VRLGTIYASPASDELLSKYSSATMAKNQKGQVKNTGNATFFKQWLTNNSADLRFKQWLTNDSADLRSAMLV